MVPVADDTVFKKRTYGRKLRYGSKLCSCLCYSEARTVDKISSDCITRQWTIVQACLYGRQLSANSALILISVSGALLETTRISKSVCGSDLGLNSMRVF